MPPEEYVILVSVTKVALADASSNTLNGWTGVLFLGIFCSGLAYIAWYDARQALSAAQTGAFLYIEPLVAVVAAAIVLAKPITRASLLGGAVILFGVWLVNRKEGARLKRKQAWVGRQRIFIL